MSKARNLVLQQAAGAAIGPSMRKLAKAARSASQLTTWAELNLRKCESVELQVEGQHRSQGYFVAAGFRHETPALSSIAPVDAPSFEKGMQNLVNLWYRGKLRPDSIGIEARKCPLTKDELKTLAIAAWHEACGLPVPSAEQIEQRQQQQKSADQQLREEMLAELRTGGAAAVKKWNAQDVKDWSRVGKFRRLDLSGAKLAGIRLTQLDFERSVFDDATLRAAHLGGTQLAGANFKGTNLTKAWLACSRCQDADFEGACLSNAKLSGANFRRASFKDANLANADLSYSNLCGTDLSGANLQGVEFAQTWFDEQTRWPAGFVPPEGMLWKGKGPDPRRTPPAPLPPPSGPIDFAAFVQREAGEVDWRPTETIPEDY